MRYQRLRVLDFWRIFSHVKIRKMPVSYTHLLYTRFSNYKNSKKWFVLYLVVLAFCLFFFPIVNANGSRVWFLFSWMLWKSSLVILIAMIGLFCRNLSISFKNWVTQLCSLREDEPLVDFLLLWIIVSVFMWVMDWVNIPLASGVTQKVWLINGQVIIDGLLLLGWLVWSFVTLRKMSSKSTKRDVYKRQQPMKKPQVTSPVRAPNTEQIVTKKNRILDPPKIIGWCGSVALNGLLHLRV